MAEVWTNFRVLHQQTLSNRENLIINHWWSYLVYRVPILYSLIPYPIMNWLKSSLLSQSKISYSRARGFLITISILLFFYSLLSISLNYTSIWVYIGNGERGTYESFLFFIILIISTREKKPALYKILLTGFILLMFIFNYFWLEVHRDFRAGLFFLP